ncbi:MAG: hypothetical protein FJ290_07625 [Planctomycetes bacterium]|nr:hypothetical protein [Planctomycetota bacterium]
MHHDSPAAFGNDAAELLQLAELEARRHGAKEVEVRHLTLALAQHPRWKAPFAELGLPLERLRTAILEAPAKAPEPLPQAEELQEVVKRAKKLLPSSKAPLSGGHLLRAILESEGAVARAISSETGVPLFDMLTQPKLLGLPVKVGRVQGVVQSIGLALRRLGHWTVLAFAWSAVSAFALYFVARWLLGPDRGAAWFPWLVLLIGAACALGLAAQRAWRVYRRRKEARSPFAPRLAKKEPPKKA